VAVRTSTHPNVRSKNVQRWQAWFKALGSAGHFKDPSHRTPLEPTAQVVRGSDNTVSDGPFAEAKDVVNGYMRIEARDLAEAMELSKGCPILHAGGSVEVRPILKPKS
jgi:hypothetical protein